MKYWSYLFVASNILKSISVFSLYKIENLTCRNKKSVSSLTITTLSNHTQRDTHTRRGAEEIKKGKMRDKKGVSAGAKWDRDKGHG